jgi:hypothetical protein
MSVDTTLPDGGTTSGRPGETPDSGPSAAPVDDLVAIFRRVLEREDVTPDADFFALGGDSLLGTRVLSAIARGHGVELDFGDLLAAPTPRGLAEKTAAAR